MSSSLEKRLFLIHAGHEKGAVEVINARIDGKDYKDIDTIVVGGKTIELSGGDGGSPATAGADVFHGGWTQATTLGTGKKKITHGIGRVPDIIIVESDFMEFYVDGKKPTNSILVQHSYVKGVSKTFGTITTAYVEGKGVTTIYCTSPEVVAEGHIVDVDENSFSIKCAGNRRLDAGLTYKWTAIVLNDGGQNQ